MTNFEFYKDEIEKRKYWFGIKKNRDGIMPCGVNCDGCFFYDGGCNCNASDVVEWLYAEHIEQPKLTKQEHDFLYALALTYNIARDKDGTTAIYDGIPEKITEYEWGGVTRYLSIRDDYFPFIKWEDPEPWSVAELLKLEVIE